MVKIMKVEKSSRPHTSLNQLYVDHEGDHLQASQLQVAKYMMQMNIPREAM
jgi:hypothetical protein